LTGAPINIGDVGTYSGFSSEASDQGLAAMNAWVDYTNAHGGINGHPVKLYSKDDAGSATKSLAAVKELVEQDHVVAIVGQHESGLESSWQKYIDAAKIPVIGGIASSAAWLTDPNFYPTNLNPVNTLTMSVYATVLAGESSFGVVYCAEVPGCAQAATLTAGAAKSLHITYAGGLSISASSSSYAAQCLQLKNKDAASVFTATSIDVSERLIANCKSQGFSPTWIDDTENWGASHTANPVWDGAWIYADGVGWMSQKPAMVEFRAAMAQYAPKADINTASASTTWGAGELFKAAAAGIGADATPTAAAITEGLYSLGPNFTAGGTIPPVTFTKGAPATQQPCASYFKVVDKKLTTPQGTEMVCLPASG
jgi:branched-chain amino acid transport system substrate-binding protein